jgi:hypothetical protein
MSAEDITFVIAMSCVIPAVAGLCRYNSIGNNYHPFVYMMWLSVMMEILDYLGIKHLVPIEIWMITINIYMLGNFALFLFFVRINDYLSEKTMWILVISAVLVYVFNAFFIFSFFAPYFYLLCFVSAAMLIISIDILSRQMMAVKYKLVKNFWFWMSSFSIIYNAFTLLIFGLYFFAIRQTPKGNTIGNIQHIANALCYVFFAIAILKIPTKKNQSL